MCYQNCHQSDDQMIKKMNFIKRGKLDHHLSNLRKLEKLSLLSDIIIK